MHPRRLDSGPLLGSDLVRRLVFPQPDINGVSQEVVRRPGQIGDLRDKLWLDPMHARQDERRSEPGCARRSDTQGRCRAGKRIEAAPEIGKDLDGHPRAHAAGVDELPVIRVVAQQERPEMRPRSFRVGPTDDDEFLAIERLGFAP
jgi:hypothetical protein